MGATEGYAAMMLVMQLLILGLLQQLSVDSS